MMNDEIVNVQVIPNGFVDAVFGKSGALAQHLDGYQVRNGQVKLAEEIAKTINNGGVLLADAPTGAGKSNAYAAPLIAYAIKAERPVLIVTANKALQEQLAEKDLPILQDALRDTLGKKFSFKVLKGRQNYLCRRELMIYDSKALPWPSGHEQDGEAISSWGMITETGEHNEAPDVDEALWRKVSVMGEGCDRQACSYYKECFAEKAVKEADTVNVIVMNYDLFLAKLVHSNGEGGERIPFGAVVLDESHEMATVARRVFTRTVSEQNVRRLATLVNDRLGDRDLAKRLRAVASPLFEKIANYARETHGRLDDPNFIDVEDLCGILDMVRETAKGACTSCEPKFATQPNGRTATCIDCVARRQIEDKAKDTSRDLRAFVAQDDDETAYWLEKPMDVAKLTGATVKLCAAPYYVGEQLRKLVFERYGTVICVSATLTSGGSFNFIRDELGLNARGEGIQEENDAPKKELIVKTIKIPSPFNYAKQAKLIIPLGIPFPISEQEALFDVAAAKAITQLVQDCRGRTLALFTSWRRLNYVADQLRDKIDYPLLVQGSSANNRDIARMFREQTNSVLLATRSFWMGLDVSGESLSCLVVDKLPFESFDDPFISLMKEKHPDTYFEDFYVPRAAIALAQGAGRLIRSTSDVGVFVLLDQRIKTKKYGRTFLASMPFVGFSQDIADAGKFLNGG
jgi:ATP-dependent DNA helicase DinG